MLEVRIKRTLPGFVLDVEFAVGDEVLGILGPSGSGKTMSLHSIAGLVRPDEGYIRLNDRVLFDSLGKINVPSRDRRVGLVFQNYALFPHLTAYDNIAYGIRSNNKLAVNQRVRNLIDKMRLDGLQNRYPRQLSAGQQQRVAVARALAPEPDVLLFDEPFSALDSLTKEQLENEVLELRKFYKGNIILVTHDLAEAYRLSSRIAVIESGRVIQCDDKVKLTSSPINEKVARITRVSNLLEGVITDIWYNGAIISVPALGIKIRVHTGGSHELTVNRKVTLGVRPENVRAVAYPGENTVQGTLDTVAETLDEIDCHFRLQSVEAKNGFLEAILPKSTMRSFSEGQSYHLYLPPEQIILIEN